MSLRLYEKFLEYIGCQWVGTGDDEEAAKAVLDARIAQAETAERLAEALMRTIHGGANQFAEWGLIDQYRAAREAVRKLEGQT